MSPHWRAFLVLACALGATQAHAQEPSQDQGGAHTGEWTLRLAGRAGAHPDRPFGVHLCEGELHLDADLLSPPLLTSVDQASSTLLLSDAPRVVTYAELVASVRDPGSLPPPWQPATKILGKLEPTGPRTLNQAIETLIRGRNIGPLVVLEVGERGEAPVATATAHEVPGGGVSGDLSVPGVLTMQGSIDTSRGVNVTHEQQMEALVIPLNGGARFLVLPGHRVAVHSDGYLGTRVSTRPELGLGLEWQPLGRDSGTWRFQITGGPDVLFGAGSPTVMPSVGASLSAPLGR